MLNNKRFSVITVFFLVLSLFVFIACPEQDLDITGVWQPVSFSEGDYKVEYPNTSTMDFDGDGEEETFTYHRYIKFDSEIYTEFVNITDVSVDPGYITLNTGMYHCSINDDAYSVCGNSATFFEGDISWTFDGEICGNTLTFHHYEYGIEWINQEADECEISTVDYEGLYCAALGELE